jgi:hypothetical protein
MTRRKLVRVVEIAETLGVSKQRADQLRSEPDFPGAGWPLGSRGICGLPLTFDGGRGPTLAAHPGGARALSRFFDDPRSPAAVLVGSWPGRGSAVPREGELVAAYSAARSASAARSPLAYHAIGPRRGWRTT